MKICVKRVYCPACHRLTRPREEKANGMLRILCQRCGKLLWTKDSVSWKYEARGVS